MLTASFLGKRLPEECDDERVILQLELFKSSWEYAHSIQMFLWTSIVYNEVSCGEALTVWSLGHSLRDCQASVQSEQML